MKPPLGGAPIDWLPLVRSRRTCAKRLNCSSGSRDSGHAWRTPGRLIRDAGSWSASAATSTTGSAATCWRSSRSGARTGSAARASDHGGAAQEATSWWLICGRALRRPPPERPQPGLPCAPCGVLSMRAPRRPQPPRPAAPLACSAAAAPRATLIGSSSSSPITKNSRVETIAMRWLPPARKLTTP